MLDSQTTTRASHWSFTVNNPTEEDRIAIRTQPRWLRRVKWQDEMGENGTLHIQGYANTDQIRLSALKEWLHRAHFKACITKEHIQNTIDYVGKSETSIENSQNDIVYKGKDSQPITMANMLTQLAMFAYSAEQIKEYCEGTEDMKAMPIQQVYEKEYWHCVSMMISQEPDLIQTFTMPQYKTAWVKTRAVWIQKYLVDSQTKVNVLSSGEISPVSV